MGDGDGLSAFAKETFIVAHALYGKDHLIHGKW